MAEPTRRVALVTGVSRRQGIGFAIAKRLLEDGLSVMLHSWAPHDAAQPWAPPAGELDAVVTELGGLGDRLGHVSADFADASAPREVIESVIERFGAIDVLIVNHARSSSGGLDAVSAEELDLSWSVNARAAVLPAQTYGSGLRSRSLECLTGSGWRLVSRHRPRPPTPDRVIPMSRRSARRPDAGDIAEAIVSANGRRHESSSERRRSRVGQLPDVRQVPRADTRSSRASFGDAGNKGGPGCYWPRP